MWLNGLKGMVCGKFLKWDELYGNEVWEGLLWVLEVVVDVNDVECDDELNWDFDIVVL